MFLKSYIEKLEFRSNILAREKQPFNWTNWMARSQRVKKYCYWARPESKKPISKKVVGASTTPFHQLLAFASSLPDYTQTSKNLQVRTPSAFPGIEMAAHSLPELHLTNTQSFQSKISVKPDPSSSLVVFSVKRQLIGLQRPWLGINSLRSTSSNPTPTRVRPLTVTVVSTLPTA